MATFCCTASFCLFFDCLLLNNRPSRFVCIYTALCIWLGWGGDRGEVHNRGLLTFLITHPLPVPALGSEAGGAESDSQAEGGITSLISSGILLFSTIWIRMALPLCCPPCSSSPPCHANTFPRTASSVLLPVCLLPSLTCVASPLLITPISIFNLLLPASPYVWLILFKKCKTAHWIN